MLQARIQNTDNYVLTIIMINLRILHVFLSLPMDSSLYHAFLPILSVSAAPVSGLSSHQIPSFTKTGIGVEV